MDLDAILDEALDEFDERSLQEQATNHTLSTGEEKDNVVTEDTETAERRMNAEQMTALLASLQDPSHGDSLVRTLKAMSTTKEEMATVDGFFQSLAQQYESNYQSSLYPNGPNDAAGISRGDREISAAMNQIGSAQKDMEGFEPDKLEEVGENMMNDMMMQFESLGEKEDYNEVVDGVMRQLLSKDLMYEPTKMICDKFPEWLALNRKNLTSSEYQNYGMQYQTFQNVLAVYDSEPDNFPRLMELLYDLQQYGQPPAEIIKDLAPGLRFDEHGMPIMPNMGAGTFPNIGNPNTEALPNLSEINQSMANGQCTLS